MRHVVTVGRPEGGSGMLPTSLLRSFEACGGTLRTSTRVEAIVCGARGIEAVRTADGEEITANVVVSACDPRRTFVEWLRDPPPAAEGLVRRWAAKPGSTATSRSSTPSWPISRGCGRCRRS
jgi:phytoene dehydrogenase-like protein